MAKTKPDRWRSTRDRCRKLAVAIDCSIEIDEHHQDGERYSNYWVWGPDCVYRNDDAHAAARKDPYAGDHVATDWGEVFERLEGYHFDLFFEALGVPHDLTWRLFRECEEEGARLLVAWVYGPSWPRRLRLNENRSDDGRVLADWLTDQGKDDLAAAVRGAVLAYVSHFELLEKT